MGGVKETLNICIYVQISEKEKKTSESIDNLYHATLQSTDYLMDIQQKQEVFQEEIINQQIEINKANDEMLKFHIKHEININNLGSMTENIKNNQKDMLQEFIILISGLPRQSIIIF